jgi:hypothetical protein
VLGSLQPSPILSGAPRDRSANASGYGKSLGRATSAAEPRARGRDGRKFRDRSEAAFLPMKAGYRDLKSLNENLRPLERYLSRQVNRPWDMVYRDMCAVIDGRSAVQRHILEHLRQYVAIRTSVKTPKPRANRSFPGSQR